MLVVTVDLDGDVEPVAQGVAVAGLDGATDAEVDGQVDHGGARSQGPRRGVVLASRR